MDRSKRWLIISLFVSLGSLLLILFVIPETSVTGDTFRSLKNIRGEYLFLAIGIHIMALFLWGMRLKVLTKAIGGDIGLLESMNIIIPSLFAACITPSKFGGEPVRLYLLNKKGISVGDSTAVVVGERLLDAFFLGLSMPLSLYIFSGHYEVVMLPVLFSAVLFFIFLMGILAYILSSPDDLKRFCARIARRMNAEKHIERINSEIDNFHSSFWRFMRNNRTSLLIAMIFTSLFWLAEVSIASFILIGLGIDPMWSTSFAAQIILAVFITIPITPGSSGVAELGITSVYGTLVTSSAMLGLFVLIWRFVTYYINFIIGGIAGGVLSFKILRDIESP